MFPNITKRFFNVVLLIGIASVSRLIVIYEESVGSSPDFSLLTYAVGLTIGISASIAWVALEINRPKDIKPCTLTRSGTTLLGTFLLMIVAGAVFLYTFFANAMIVVDKIGLIAYGSGFVVGIAAVFLLYYLPKYLPQEKTSSRE